ncbi:MAG TPA: choice-of-anchor D domain-containing protein [Candidatus Cloacimonetes bacterium]|nr:choice-of-anchor D domain-containing protein [Candidatus Cloacimonadota bacterium]
MKTRLSFILLLALLLGIFSTGHAATVQVGDNSLNTSVYPIYGLYDFSYTQQIYTQSQINSAGEITKIRFYYKSGAMANSKDWKIWIGHTTKSSFAGASDWEPIADLTMVFDGDVTDMVPAGNNWMEIILTTPFEYNNTDNLVVAVHQYTDGYRGVSWGGFASGADTGLCYRADNTDLNPATPPDASMISSTISSIQLVFPDTEVPLAPVLVAPADGTSMMTGQSLSWEQPAGGADVASYDVYIDGVLASNQIETTYVLPGMDPGTHSWYVVARNNVGESPASETRTFVYTSGTIIGEGTNRQRDPFNCWYGFGRSLGLYTADQVGQLGLITNLGWSVETAGTAVVPYKIYVATTTDELLTEMTWNAFTADATLVKEGEYTFDSTGWHVLPLDTHFPYVGGNLLVGVEANFGGTGADGYPWFHYTAGVSGVHQTWARDNFDPNDDTGALNNRIPNVLMLFAPIGDEPVFTINPEGWDFGQVVLNETSTQAFTITNTGGGTLSITGFNALTDGFFTITDAPEFPVDLATGANMTFNIQYAPTEEGLHTATFTINDGRAATELVVSGEGFDPTITIFPNTSDFDSTPVGEVPTGWTVFASNTGADDRGWKVSTGYGYTSEPNAIATSWHPYYPKDEWLITPALELEAGQSYNISFMILGTGWSGVPEALKVHWATSPSPDLMLANPALWDNEGAQYIDWTEETFTFTPSVRGIYYLGWHAYSAANLNFIALDDITIDRGDDPTVPVELSSFNATLTAQNFVKLTWVSQTETGMWGYRVYRGESDNQADATLLTPTLIPATNTSSTQTYNLEDKEVEIGSTYWYWLEAVEINGSGMFYGQPASVTVTGEVPAVLPTVTTMGNAYPNPFKQTANTTIDVDIKEGENGTVTIYNILGQVVQTFKLNEGFHKLNWNGQDARGNRCGSGIYFYKLSTPSTNMTKKMVLVK